jgi:hypothetical protein
MEVRGERHAASQESRGNRRACKTNNGYRLHQRGRVKLFIEVMTLVVATPLMLVLDGDAAIFTIVTLVELNPEVSGSDARCRYMQRDWRVCIRWCMCSQWLVNYRWHSRG